MERIARALELAHAQRDPGNARGAAAEAPVRTTPVAPAQVVDAASQMTWQEADGDNTPPVFVARSVQVDRTSAEGERILQPSASGREGASYKLLRTQVLQRLDQLRANSLAILSASASEGKTLTAINLAIAVAAELGRTALLVDFDLRNPSVHKRLGFEPKVGVEACLQSSRPAQDVIVRLSGYPRLSVMPARDPVEHSSELLASERATRLVHELRSRYADRIVIFDLPPVLLGDDALAFSPSVQAGLFVIAEGRTQREEVSSSLTLLRELPIIGTVLNGSREPQRSPYG
jgi:protein-tyrosine kinase